MKAQFKFAFLSGLHVRGIVFAVIFAINTTFITLWAFDWLPLAVHIIAVILGGFVVTVMMAAVNIIGDVTIARNMFSAPRAYLQMLTPTPRWKTLFASLTAMAVMDIFTMAFVISSQMWLAVNLAGRDTLQATLDWINQHTNISIITSIIWGIVIFIAGYLLIVNIILFCVTVNKSVLYKKPASGFLTFLLACGCVYLVSLTPLILVPFGEAHRVGIFIIMSLSETAIPFYVLLILLQGAGLFVLTSKLMERKMNI
jgi:hypothetical protein